MTKDWNQKLSANAFLTQPLLSTLIFKGMFNHIDLHF